MTNPDAETRLETDSMGSVQVPAARYYGAQTARSLAHFAIGEERMPLAIVHALARVKQAAALTHAELGVLPVEMADAIAAAADEVAQGARDGEFPLRVWQTGSGTQTHMNVNEVIANLASERMGGQRGQHRLVHPNDHVNRSQSSNDAFPTAMHVAALDALQRDLLPALRALHGTLEAHAVAHADLVKLGRTHLQDATPLTLGQEISGWAAQLADGIVAVEASQVPLRRVALGGTAVGTGLNTPDGYVSRVIARLASLTGHALSAAPNRFAALAAHDAVVGCSGALRQLAGALTKIANDVRWLASGPRAGIGELRLPANEPGSSIMPGKVNPTQCEALVMVCCQVFGNDATIGFAGSQGNFELNVCKPVMAYSLLQSIGLLADAVASFDVHCVRGMTPDREHIADHVGRSLMLVTALVPQIGYERAAQLAEHAHHRGLTLRQAAMDLGTMSGDAFDALVRPAAMTGPGGNRP